MVYFETKKLNVENIIFVTTDDAPINVLFKNLKNNQKWNSNLLLYLCIFYQNVCCKLYSCLEEVMKAVMIIFYCIRANYSLQHRQFK